MPRLSTGRLPPGARNVPHSPPAVFDQDARRSRQIRIYFVSGKYRRGGNSPVCLATVVANGKSYVKIKGNSDSQAPAGRIVIFYSVVTNNPGTGYAAVVEGAKRP